MDKAHTTTTNAVDDWYANFVAQQEAQGGPQKASAEEIADMDRTAAINQQHTDISYSLDTDAEYMRHVHASNDSHMGRLGRGEIED